MRFSEQTNSFLSKINNVTVAWLVIIVVIYYLFQFCCFK